MGKSESIVQQEIILEAARHGIRLMRNNVGAGVMRDEHTGNESYVRFGLLNESKEMNKRIKSSDLISLMPPTGQFIAIEVKHEGWRYVGTQREKAQLAFIEWVRSLGGKASFCQSVDDFLKLIGKA